MNPDDDTVRIIEGEETGLEEVLITPAPAESPWTSALGTVPQWIWVLENQQGYHDGLQFGFAVDGAEVCRVQLIAAASSWQVSVVRPWTA